MIKIVVIVVLLLWAAIEDIRKREIQDVIPCLILGVGLVDLHFVDSLLGIALTGLPCFLIALITSRENKLSIGGGDIKLISACAIAFGSVSISVLQNVVAMILAILYGFVTKKKSVSMIYGILTQKNKTKGEVRLNNLLRSGKVLKILTLKNDDVKKFTQEAKKYGVTYCMLRDKSLNDGITDIIVKAEDAPKINRIVERFKLVSTQSENPKQSSENPIINPTNPENPTLVQTEKSSQLEDTLKTQEKSSVREQLQKINNVKKACVLDKKHEKTK